MTATPERRWTPRRLTLMLVAVIVTFAAVNVALFYLPLYRLALDPASSTATFDAAVNRLAAWPANPATDVLVLGDSRVYSGLAPEAAGAAANGLRFLNAGVPGTTPRAWYYYLRAVDPSANRFHALVITVDSYTDDTSAVGSLDAAVHQPDLHYILFHTALGDVVPLAGSFESPQLERDLAVQLLLRGPIMRDDFQALLDDPSARIASHGTAGGYDFDPAGTHPRTENLGALQVDFVHDHITEPPTVAPAEQTEMDREILPLPAPNAAYGRYRLRWLGPIVQRYRAAGVPVLFVRIPTRPAHRSLPPPPAGSLVELEQRYGAVLIPQTAYVALEQPNLFADHDHLDAAGAVVFSRLLGRDIATALKANGSAASATEPIPESELRPGPHNGFITQLRSFAQTPAPLLFQSADFALFLAIVLGLFFVLPKRLCASMLLIASYYFYLRWNNVYLLLLLGLTVSDYAIARAISVTTGRRRHLLLTAGVGANLLFLGIFKYTNFVTGNIAQMLGMQANPWVLQLLVPLGISFHTFQSISYLVDVARAARWPR